MAIHKTEAIVLKKQDFRETSLIVNFYTRDFGKVSGILKGIRQDPVKFASAVEPFSYNEIVFYRKRNSALHLVSQCDVRENFTQLRQHVFKTTAASIIAELISTVMAQEDKNEAVFDLMLESLKGLEINAHTDKIMIIFKIKALALSGFQPHFDSCVSCGSEITSQTKFSLSLGGLLCMKCFSKDMYARSVFRGTVASMRYIQKNDFRTNLNLGLNPEIKKELDLILNSFLNFHLERELKSQKVLNKMAVAVF